MVDISSNLMLFITPPCVNASCSQDGKITLHFDDGTSRDATPTEICAVLRDYWRAEVYRIAAQLLDAQSIGYSPVEVATWPVMQSEIIAYNSNGTVGPAMQSVIDRGRHTAATLSALLTPKITYQAAVLLARDVHIEAINALPSDTQDYDTSAGWPSA